MMFLKDINLLLSRDKCGMSPILKAAELGHLGVVNMIISKTPQSVKTTDESGRNVLHWAARCRDDEIREQLNSLLSSKGANRNAKDMVKYAILKPLHRASQKIMFNPRLNIPIVSL